MTGFVLNDSKLLKFLGDGDFSVEFNNIYSKYSNFMTGHMSLFKEYTDHSIEHVNYVIETAEKLISDSAFEYINQQDVFTLLLSIVYHDMGMHIGKEGIKLLINQEKNLNNVDKEPLKTVWTNYVKELSRMDEDELKRTFEDSLEEEVKPEDYERNIENEVLLREFVRRNHHRLAHEIALFGFPTKERKIKFQDDQFLFYHNLAGFVARSHGMELRETFEILREEFYEDWKTPRNIHVVYLMCILRVADYLHITNDRVNPYQLQMFNFKSNRSKIEHEKHLCTYESHKIYDSPQILYITSEPDRLDIYLEMDYLIDRIQNELDKSWAVLGEVYGNSNLGLSIRRINSNIKSSKWLDKRDFVPERIKFNIDHRVMSLLIDPLYGSNPSFGIRELLQNAIDACRELNVYNKDNRQVEVKYSEGEDDEKYLTIKDNGSGMNLEIIKNYFLKIGAPFRKSAYWKDSSEKGEITRNGRFGIGVLSSFLLGDVISVKTKRHTCFKEDNTSILEFTTELYSDSIQIRKRLDESNEFVGTEVSIKLNELTKRAIEQGTLIISEWFTDKDVNVIVDSNNIDIKESSDNSTNEVIWKNIEQQKKIFDEVKWSYEYEIEPFSWKVDYKNKENDEITKLEPNLICNGIVIPEKYDRKISDMIVEKWPVVSIKDLEGNLDLDLSRYKLNSGLPFMNELIRDVYKYFVYKLLSIELLTQNSSILTTTFKLENYKSQKIMFYKNGFSLLNPYFLKKNEISKMVHIYTTDIKSFKIDSLDDNTAYIIERVIASKNDFKSAMKNPNSIDDLNISNSLSFLIRDRIYWRHMDEYTSNQVKLRESDRNKISMHTVRENNIDEFKMVSYSNKQQSPTSMKALLNNTGLGLKNLKMMVVFEDINFDNIKNFSYYQNIFSDYFSDTNVLPYDLNDRKDSFSSSFKELEDEFDTQKKSPCKINEEIIIHSSQANIVAT